MQNKEASAVGHVSKVCRRIVGDRKSTRHLDDFILKLIDDEQIDVRILFGVTPGAAPIKCDCLKAIAKPFNFGYINFEGQRKLIQHDS
jgi:hypothetical protein